MDFLSGNSRFAVQNDGTYLLKITRKPLVIEKKKLTEGGGQHMFNELCAAHMSHAWENEMWKWAFQRLLHYFMKNPIHKLLCKCFWILFKLCKLLFFSKCIFCHFVKTGLGSNLKFFEKWHIILHFYNAHKCTISIIFFFFVLAITIYSMS